MEAATVRERLPQLCSEVTRWQTLPNGRGSA